MKNGYTGKIPVLTTLLTLAIAAGFLYFSGCVVIPEGVFVVSGNQDKVHERVISSCESGENRVISRDGSSGVDPHGFSILSWNSHKGSDEAWAADLASQAEDVDFILLQEAALDAGLREQLKVLAREWLLAIAFRAGGKEIGILSAGHIPPRSYCALREPEPLLMIPKMILVSRYPIAETDSDLLVVNVHMVNFTIGSDAVRRQIDAIFAIVENHRGPVIVAGDFNTWNDERELMVGGKMKELGLQSVFFSPDNRVTFFKRTVDGVYYRGLEVTKALSRLVKTSDHNPLEVHFKLVSEGSSS